MRPPIILGNSGLHFTRRLLSDRLLEDGNLIGRQRILDETVSEFSDVSLDLFDVPGWSRQPGKGGGSEHRQGLRGSRRQEIGESDGDGNAASWLVGLMEEGVLEQTKARFKMARGELDNVVRLNGQLGIGRIRALVKPVSLLFAGTAINKQGRTATEGNRDECVQFAQDRQLAPNDLAGLLDAAFELVGTAIRVAAELEARRQGPVWREGREGGEETDSALANRCENPGAPSRGILVSGMGNYSAGPPPVRRILFVHPIRQVSGGDGGKQCRIHHEAPAC